MVWANFTTWILWHRTILLVRPRICGVVHYLLVLHGDENSWEWSPERDIASRSQIFGCSRTPCAILNAHSLLHSDFDGLVRVNSTCQGTFKCKNGLAVPSAWCEINSVCLCETLHRINAMVWHALGAYLNYETNVFLCRSDRLRPVSHSHWTWTVVLPTAFNSDWVAGCDGVTIQWTIQPHWMFAAFYKTAWRF